METKIDVYSRVTDKILAQLEQGVRPWMRPWAAANTDGRITRPLRHNGQPYSGVNVLMLWGAACTKGYSNPTWLTFKQALELGGNVRKGETGELVVYAGSIAKTETNRHGEEIERAIPFMKGYTVFNAEQCENLPAHYTVTAEQPIRTQIQRIEAADRFFAATGADIRHGGMRAFFAFHRQQGWKHADHYLIERAKPNPRRIEIKSPPKDYGMTTTPGDIASRGGKISKQMRKALVAGCNH